MHGSTVPKKRKLRRPGNCPCSKRLLGMGGTTAHVACAPSCAPNATAWGAGAFVAPWPPTARSPSGYDPAASCVCAPHHQLGPGRGRGAQPLTRPAGPHRPNQVWVGDITYLPRQGGVWLYFATWLDRCSRKVVGWDLRNTMPEDLVSEALRRALSVRQLAAGLVVQSDQGSQYSVTRFKDLLAHHGAQQRMSRRGNCYDNAHAESFWSRLKTEWLDGGSFPGLAEAHLVVSQYIA